MKTAFKAASFLAIVTILFVTSSYAEEENAAFDRSWNVSLGGGMHFFEGDEEVKSNQIYELKVGRQCSPRYSWELGLGVLPYLESREFDDARFHLSENNTWGMKAEGNVLYHFNDDVEKTFDPFASAGLGAFYHEATFESGDLDPYGALGVGSFYNATDKIFLRGDYRVSLVGHDTEVNHEVLLSVGYRFGGSRSGSGSGSDDMRIGKEIEALKRVHFAFDSAKLNNASKETLTKNAEWLSKESNPEIVIEGHCDERGTNEYNYALGERRAQSVYEYLKNLGVPAKTMSTVTYGEDVPADPGHNEEAWSKNRRAEFKLK